ncbi:hypothetical protein [Ramlibacter sp. 2FC]|uniref:hypothetical protein n=1 Tax=Ramlibacter sp. 2FC TaxID=2502188 RepID=UPI0010F89582|nr:hypothetical protein [Ramlibacter sp. 2FC]
MHRIFGHPRRSWRPRGPHWLLAPVGVSVSLSMLGVWIVPDFVLMGPEVLPPGIVLAAPGAGPAAPASGSFIPLPPVETARRGGADGKGVSAPRF